MYFNSIICEYSFLFKMPPIGYFPSCHKLSFPIMLSCVRIQENAMSFHLAVRCSVACLQAHSNSMLSALALIVVNANHDSHLTSTWPAANL